MKVYFITFANKQGTFWYPPRYTVDRIVDEAKASSYFDSSFGFCEQDLDENFWQRHKKFILSHPRGFGYWVWKPKIALQFLQKIKDGDIMVFCDAGCSINKTPKAKKRMADYMKAVQKSPAGIVCFQIDGTPYLEKYWTKNDLLIKMKANDKIKNSGQILSGIWLVKKSARSVKLIREWLRLAESDYHLIDDSPSRTKNDEGFCEHRHDQSIFSLLCKTHGVTIFLNESNDVASGKNIPIIASRKYKKYWWRRLPKLWQRAKKFIASLHQPSSKKD